MARKKKSKSVHYQMLEQPNEVVQWGTAKWWNAGAWSTCPGWEPS